MDKKEYQEKLDEINRLIAVEDYDSAAQVADSIEWKRVRNVRTLLMISEIYEAVNRYQDSKILLLRAYRRSPLGRTVLYRLVECTVALRQFDEAIEYYSEYVQAAPRDNNKYILKYKIYRGRGSSLDEQIDILKEYLAQEKDSERWSYELAKLYREAGRTQECINTCDDLVLWYQSGRYVIKALELKKKIAPLTPRQQEIYDSRFDEETDDDADEEAEASYLQQARAEKASLQQEAIKSELAQDISKAASRQAAAGGSAQELPSSDGRPAGKSYPETRVLAENAMEGAPAEGAQAEAAENVPAEGAQTEAAVNVPAEGARGEAAEAAPAEGARGEAAKAAPAEGAQAEAAKAAPAEGAQAEGQPDIPDMGDGERNADEGVHYDEKTLKQNLAESMKQIVSGVGPRDTVDEEEEQLDRVIEQSKEDQEAAVAARGLGMTLGMRQNAALKPEAPRLTIDDILLSMDDKGDSVRKAQEKAAAEKEEAAVTEKAAEDAAAVKAAADHADAEDRAQEEAPETSAAEDRAQEETPETSAAEDRAQEEAPGETSAADNRTQEETPDETSMAAGADHAEIAAKWQEASMGDILEAKTRVLPTEEIAKLHEEFLRRERAVKDAGARMAEKVAAEAEAQERAEAEVQQAGGPVQEPGQAEAPQAGGPGKEPETAQVQAEEAAGAKVMRELRPETDVEEPRYMTKKTYLKPYHRDLFRGFLEIGNLEEQIARAIAQAEMKGQDRTSRTGNVLILGGHGCGKTTIATGIAKAVAEDMGTHSVKMARIYAADLNRKDIAATIAKIAGGVLIIEEAGDLEDSIVDQLTTAMEFRTDGMIMILEDEQRYIHDLLMRHPRFTMKFTAQIYIPAFSTDDLVNFGELYAESRDCTFSDDAKAALTGRLEAAAKAGETVSITNVVELTGRAIRNSGKFFRRMQSARKRYDDQNRVVLRAKDFR